MFDLVHDKTKYCHDHSLSLSTGEADWVRSMIAQWQSTAEQTGAILVPFCGHDSVPWDYLVWKMQQLLRRDCQDDLESVTFWDEFRLTAPGGTLATLNASAEGKLDTPPMSSSSSSSPSAETISIDPLLRVPVEQDDVNRADIPKRTIRRRKSKYRLKANLPTFIAPSNSPWDRHGDKRGRWTLPFVMAGVNAKVVQWSHALRQVGHTHLTYSEQQVVPNFRTAFCNYFGGAVSMMILMGNPLTHDLLKRFVFFQPGQGPSQERMETKNYQYITGEGVGVHGNRVQVALYFTKDVGCLETARMMVEAALCLAHTNECDLPISASNQTSGSCGGFYPPSVAFGDLLFDRILNEDTHYACKTFPSKDTKPTPRSTLRSRL